jgi:CheY-like chemotaxis protein
VAKILVADDNSNIQKMVGLALKDQGIDVVAVGNGEAAVRKISDVRPDLVLADVFMPVRNGYEVCKYVKDDSSLAHIPVILLVGAFDPLDEQEAQRVGADGVLKKPFVPPDPLISMVKSALARVGVLPSDKPAEPPPMAAVDLIAPRVPEASQGPGVGDFGQPETADHATAAPEPVRMDSGAPLAFGNLLETPVAKEEEEEVSYLTGASTQIAPERTWRSPDEPEEVEEEEEPRSSWRRDGEELEDDGTSGGRGTGDWRDTVMAEAPTRRSARESWEPAVAAKEEPVTVATTETLPAPTTISSAKPLAEPFAGDAWAAAVSPTGSEEKAAAIEQAPVVEQLAPVVEERKPETAGKNSSMAENWFSPAPSPWDAELKKASELATGWDSPKAGESASAYASEVIAKEEVVAEQQSSVEAVAQEAGLSTSAVEAIRQEAGHVAETAPAAVASGAAAEPKMDDLVAKVLAKMSPEALQAVTREILKPVVEAMVRDELNSKKS